MRALPRWFWIVLAVICALRMVAAARVPLTGDESYYWSWSRHLAFGYTDHPPMVAWMIASLSPLGSAPGIVRLPFVLCEAVTSIAIALTALRLSKGETRAAGIAGLAFALIPQVKLATGEALPDGPYVMSWALALWLLARAQERSTPARMALLGVALGGGILSRFFGWALIGGIVGYALMPAHRSLWRRGLWIAFAVAIAMYAPFILWNATHGWENLAFTLHDRQALNGFSMTRLSAISTLRCVIGVAAIWGVGYAVALRPRHALVAWTGLPFPTMLAFLGFFQSVESYWLLGPVVSLCVGVGIAVARLAVGWRATIATIAGVGAACATATALFPALPEGAQRAALVATHEAVKGPLYSTVFVYRPLAADVERLATASKATPVTDREELAGELLYHGVRSVMMGDAPQVDQWVHWEDIRPLAVPVPRRILVVTFAPLERRTPLSAALRRAYRAVRPGPVLAYAFAGRSAQAFFTTWCEGPRADAASIVYRGR